MPEPNFIILYVDAAPASAAFYSELLGRSPVESSPGFALFVWDSGVKFGLWTRHTVEPAVGARGSDAELAFTLDDADAVRAMHADCLKRGFPIAQEPTDMDFGYTFVTLDPDGHRLRFFVPSGR